MKVYLPLILLFCVFFSNGQNANFSVKKIKLPSEISYYDNQFSGLYISGENLLLMSESRLQDNAEPKLYALNLLDLEQNMSDSNFILPYKKHSIINLDLLRKKMADKGDEYEGLEAITIVDNFVYLSVETATPSNNCYLLRGIFKDSVVELDKFFMLPTPKPYDANGKHIYNAGYEAITHIGDIVFNLFEYNSFVNDNNYATSIVLKPNKSVRYKKKIFKELPFRITDITKTGKNEFTAINFFFKGGGEDSVYRVSIKDVANDALIRDEKGYKSYCRLISVKYKKSKFSWKPLWEFPEAYMSYNWEGIASYKKGYFIINDKYTPARPYNTVLLYLAKAE